MASANAAEENDARRAPFSRSRMVSFVATFGIVAIAAIAMLGSSRS
jgi:hypothetical protein